MGIRSDFGEAFGPHSYPIPEWPNLRFVKTSTVVFGKRSPKCVWSVLNSFIEQTSLLKCLGEVFGFWLLLWGPQERPWDLSTAMVGYEQCLLGNFANQFFLKIKKKNFFSWPYYVASGTLVLWPGLNPHPLHWESVVFTAGPPGKSWKHLLTCLISYNTFSIHCTNLFLCVYFICIFTFLEI